MAREGMKPGTGTSRNAAASIREGLDETLTLQELGITGFLYRTLGSTNPIENRNGAIDAIHAPREALARRADDPALGRCGDGRGRDPLPTYPRVRGSPKAPRRTAPS